MRNFFFNCFVIFILSFAFNSILTAQNFDLTWVNDTNVNINGNTITKTGGNGWNGGVGSENQLDGNTDGWIEIIIGDKTKGKGFGFDISNNHTTFATMDYAFLLTGSGVLRVYENGALKSSPSLSPYNVGDIIKIERIGTTIFYYRNNVELFSTLNVDNSISLYAAVGLNQVGATLNTGKSSFGTGGCSTTVYADTDGDGFGDPNSSIIDCTNPVGYVEDNTDCDDTDGAINPNTVWYQDNDGDDFGNPAVSQTQCEQPVGYVLNNTDCDDTTNDPTNNCGGGGGATVWTESGNDIRYSDGKVFIGNEALDVSSDDYNLFVEKGIMTERLKVAIEGSGDWADYVFADDYQRVKIAELEAFIKANKHLPNVPSAQEVADKGIDVAKMDATLLQQIEEIWLHVIDLKKENEALKQQIKDISKK